MVPRVNFWKRYPADYQRKTARLTLAQHGAYTLLLDELYTAESPLPAAIEELCRVCRAMNKAEQEAVRFVAERFFPVGADGARHNKRAAEELEEAAPALEAARENGKKGGRPRTQKKPTGLSNKNPVGSENKTQNEPSSKPPQSSDNSPSLRSGEPRASRLPLHWTPPADWLSWAQERRPDLDLDIVATTFANHWQAKPGKDASKLDWEKTWQNWVLKERAGIKAVSVTALSFSERATAAKAARIREMTGGLLDDTKPDFIDMEPTHARPRLG